MNVRYRAIILLIMISLVFVISSCNYRDNKKNDEVKSDVITYNYHSNDNKVKVELYLTKQNYSVVEDIILGVRVFKKEDIIAFLPKKDGISSENLTIKKLGQLITGTKNEYEVISKEYIFIAEKIGQATIKIAPIMYKIDDEEYNININDIVIDIVSYTGIDDVDSIEHNDRLDPQQLEPDYQAMTITLISIGSFYVFLIAFTLIFVKIKGKDQHISGINKLPPHIIAIEALKRLKEDQLLEKEDFDLYHQKLNMILREYIENRFNIKAPEQTTEEFLYELSNTNVIKDEHNQILKDFLTTSDLIRFAKYTPPVEYHEEAFSICEKFVKTTSSIIEDSERHVGEEESINKL